MAVLLVVALFEGPFGAERCLFFFTVFGVSVVIGHRTKIGDEL